MNPHQSSLNLLKEAIGKAPAAFPPARRKEMLNRHEELGRERSVSLAEIERVLVDFGREIWPYRKAYQALHDDYSKDEKYLLENLPPTLQAAWRAFRDSGGKLEDARGGAVFEDAFSGEEKHQIEEAFLQAREKAHRELDELITGEKKPAWQQALAECRLRQEAVSKKIAALRALADQAPKWAAEILDKVKTFEEGWSGVEREVTEDDVKGEIEYYQGVIEL